MTVEFRWNIPKVPLFNVKAAQNLFNKEATRSLNIMTEVVRTNVVFSAPTGATGQLKNTIGSSVGNNIGRVFTGKKYAVVVNEGRRAAPVAKSADKGLILWLRQTRKGRKMLLIARAMMMKHRKSKPSTAQVIKSALFLVKRGKKERPTKANPFFDRGIKRSQKRLRKESGILARRLAVGLMT